VPDYSGGLEQEIFKFDNPDDAERNFDHDDPRSYDEDFPLRVDESESYRSVSADESRLYGLGQEGSLEACPVWAYWARYGQYIMRLDHVAGLQTTDGDIFTLQPGIGLDHFLEYVQAFDENVTKRWLPQLLRAARRQRRGEERLPRAPDRQGTQRLGSPHRPRGGRGHSARRRIHDGAVAADLLIRLIVILLGRQRAAEPD
jgi:hypothetical protein